MQAAYLQAAAPEPFRVLGKDLLPFFTIGHQLLLERFDCAFAVGSQKVPTFDDLIFAIWICSRSYGDALISLSSVLTPLRLKLWAWRCGNFDPVEAMQLMAHYIATNSAQPLYGHGKNWQESSSDMPLGVFLSLRTQEALHLSHDEMMDMPFMVASLSHLRELEKSEVIQRTSPEDLRLFEAAKVLDARMRGKGLNGVAQS